MKPRLWVLARGTIASPSVGFVCGLVTRGRFARTAFWLRARLSWFIPIQIAKGVEILGAQKASALRAWRPAV